MAMCSGADSEIIAALPIVDVVSGVKTRSRIVGNLVALQPGSAKSPFYQLRHCDFFFFAEEANPPTAIFVMEGSPFFDGEVVRRQVRRLEPEGNVQVVFEISQSLSRVGVNQVEAEVFEACVTDDLYCSDCLIGGVDSTEKLEQVRLEGLHADADTIHPAGVVAGKVRAFHSSGISFQGNFAGRVDGEQRVRAFENARDARRLKGRWGTPAEKDRLDGSAAPLIHAGIMIQFLNQCVSVTCFRDFRDDVRIKIAVGTFADAIGDMNVERKWLLFSRHDSPIILTKGGRYNTLGIIVAKGAARPHPVTPKAVALELAQFSDDLLAKLRFKVSNQNLRRFHRELVEFLK